MPGMDRHQLTANFYLEEFTGSEIAARLGRPIGVERASAEYANVLRLCTHVLQPLRSALGPIFVVSGVRPLWLNTMIGGSKNSQHIRGEAADIKVVGFSPYEVVAWLISSGLPFDQVIHEFGQWVHISINPVGRPPRGQVLTAWKRPDGAGALATAYATGLHSMKDLEAAA
jgi:hypothetical protein